MNMDHHSATIDIGDLEIKGFTKSQTTGIDGGEEDIIVEGFDMVKYPKDLFPAQDAGQSSFSFSVDVCKQMPVMFQDVDEKKLDAAVADAHSCG